MCSYKLNTSNIKCEFYTCEKRYIICELCFNKFLLRKLYPTHNIRDEMSTPIPSGLCGFGSRRTKVTRDTRDNIGWGEQLPVYYIDRGTTTMRNILWFFCFFPSPHWEVLLSLETIYSKTNKSLGTIINVSKRSPRHSLETIYTGK